MHRDAANAVRSRMPLVPKELILPVCQRLALILFVMCGTALGIRIVSLYRNGKLHKLRPDLQVNGSHFFLDIGNTGNSQTRPLEDSGWRGVCVSPFPEAARSCKSIAMPVVTVHGATVLVPDCSSPMQVLLSMVRSPSVDASGAAASLMRCPRVERAGVGIENLLTLAKAPPVIDYLTLATQGTELEILQGFPFKKFCVRAWSVPHHYLLQAGIMKLFKAQNCHAKDVGKTLVWARCPCDRFSENLLQVKAVSHGGDHEPTPKRRKKNKSDSSAIVSSGVLPEEDAVTPTREEGVGSLVRRAFH